MGLWIQSLALPFDNPCSCSVLLVHSENKGASSESFSKASYSKICFVVPRDMARFLVTRARSRGVK